MSLLEIVVAISLLYLVITFVIQLLPTNLYAMIRGQSRLTAENLAHSQLQSQVVRPFSSLRVGLQENLADVSLDSRVYHSQLEVITAAAEDANHLRLVRLTVTWSERGAQRRVVREQWIHSALD